MPEKKQIVSEIKSLLIRLLYGILLIFGLVFLSKFPEFIERFYSHSFYPFIATITQFLFNNFPFSVGDILYITVVAYLVYIFIRLFYLIVRKAFRQAGIVVLQTLFKLEVAILVFYIFWGLNYFRVPAAERLGLQGECCETAEISSVAEKLIDSANFYRLRLTKADLDQDNQTIFSNAVQAVRKASKQPGLFPLYHPEIKSSLLSSMMNYMGTAGYYNPFTAEAQLNDKMPVFLRPFVACHEMAHQSGYNAEDEANFAGFLAGTSSDDKLLKYSSFYLGVEQFMFELRMRDSTVYIDMKNRISPLVLNDFKTDREYWQSFRGRTGVFSSMFYDNYLKFNNQPEGLRTYNRMVKLLIVWYRKQEL